MRNRPGFAEYAQKTQAGQFFEANGMLDSSGKAGNGDCSFSPQKVYCGHPPALAVLLLQIYACGAFTV
jgi:hypothetical protein